MLRNKPELVLMYEYIYKVGKTGIIRPAMHLPESLLAEADYLYHLEHGRNYTPPPRGNNARVITIN